MAITEINQYYDLPLVSYSYTDDMLILQIPIYVKHYQNRHWNCLVYRQFQCNIIQTENLDENHGYIWLKPDHMLAMSSSTYPALD